MYSKPHLYFALTAAVLSQPASAESTESTESAQGTASTASSEAKERPLSDEIVVTAQKREQSLQNVGIAISVFGEEEIRDLRIQSPIDLVGQTPNLAIKEINPGLLPVFTLRGVGLNDYSANNNPTVGVYVDEVYLTSTAQLVSQLYDMERIEVLKGPQGTLYGRNTTGGAINFISNKPAFERSYFVSAGYGNFQTFEGELMFNLPLSETAAARLSGKVTKQGEGYWESRTLGGESIGEQEIWSGRLQLGWQPSDKVKVNLKLEGGVSDSELGQSEHFGVFAAGVSPRTPCAPILAGRADPAQCVDAFGYSDPDGDPFVGDWNNDARSEYDQLSAALRVDWEIGAAEITSITAYQRYNRGFLSDPDSGPFVAAEFDVDDSIRQFTQEVRLAGNAASGISYLTGLFYSRDVVETSMSGNLIDLFRTQTQAEAEQKTSSAALYGNLSWEFTDSLQLNLGARYTWEEKEFVGGNTDLNPFGTSCLLSPICAPGLTGPVPVSIQNAKIDDKNFSWKVGLDFTGIEDQLLYGSISRGYKSGGFFGGGFTTSDLQLQPFKPEELTAYEIGAKTQFLNRTVRLNIAAFYYDYSDVQTFIADTSGPFVVTVLSNVDEAKIYGAEADLLWFPTDGLDFALSAGVLDTELGAFTTSDGQFPKGNKLPSAPELTFSGRARYEWPLSSVLRARIQTDASYTASEFKNANNRPLLSSDSFWVWNGRISVGNVAKGWELSVWGKNLLNKNILTHAFDNGIGNGAFIYRAPRTFGVTLALRGR